MWILDLAMQLIRSSLEVQIRQLFSLLPGQPPATIREYLGFVCQVTVTMRAILGLRNVCLVLKASQYVAE